MENVKNIMVKEKLYLKVNIPMEKDGMELEESIIIMMKLYLRVNI